MERKNLYEIYHSRRTLQKKIISNENFTYRNLISILNKHSGGKAQILDIGCGVGTICLYLGSKGKSVLGIDISRRAIKLARDNATLLGLEKKIRFLVLDFPQKLPKGRFDLILMSEVLEHLPDDEKAVKKAFQLLFPKGRLIVSVPSRNAPLFRLGVLREFDKKAGHLRRYTVDELEELIRQCGFRIIEISKTEGILRNFLFTNRIGGKIIRFFKWWVSDLAAFLDNLTIPLFGESQIYIVASKK